MRTTVDIEEHVLKRLRAEAKRRGVSIKVLLNGIIRRALNGAGATSRSAVRYRSPTFSMGTRAAHVNLDKALRAAAASEDEEAARELSLRD